MASNNQVTPDTLITVKVLFDGETRRFRIPLRDLGANTLPSKLRAYLTIPAGKNVTFERYSDSNGRYVVLNTADQAVWKQLWRAAKAKLKLRLKVTAVPAPDAQEVADEQSTSSVNYPELGKDRVDDKPATQTASEGSMAPPPPPKREHPNDVIKEIIASQKKLYYGNNASDATLRPEPTMQALPLMPKKPAEEEAPVPRPFADLRCPHAPRAESAKPKPTVLRGCDQIFDAPLTAFTVQCNNCSHHIHDTHWHCSLCEAGDYDLCPACKDAGVHCEVDSHFLIKRSIQQGRVVNSTSETAERKSVKIEEPAPEIPGAFTTETKAEVSPEGLEMTRTCNSCVNSFEESEFVTCVDCDDYDLCIPCHVNLKHGHNPSHTFSPLSELYAEDFEVKTLCAPGRNMRHFASCDGCDKTIHGVRHKCMNCPDFDFCSMCHKSASHIHPGHRFVPVYEAIAIPNPRVATHYSIRCDGPLCKRKMNFVRGDRYKCAVCDDVDFCANCEALPTNPHNRSHPLIKFHTPVRNVSVTTYGERENGETMVTMGDRIPTRSQSTSTAPAAPSANAATQVHVAAEAKPAATIKTERPASVKSERPASVKSEKSVAFKDEKPSVVEAKFTSVEEKPCQKTVRTVQPEPVPTLSRPMSAVSQTQLEAHFVQDTIADGTILAPGAKSVQTWMIRNPGPTTWPAGCVVRYIGGDHMLNIDADRASSLMELDQAIQSNTIATPVLPGAEVFFSVTIKAPQREGKAISYWRMKTRSGVPFGHKLWCDINVQKPAPEPVAPKAEEVIEPVKEEPRPAEDSAKEVHESQMVFPTLDKESPAHSTHENVPSTTEAGPSSAPSTTSDEPEEDLESLDMDDDNETDECYLTDEEYDIIDDAESEEAVNGKK